MTRNAPFPRFCVACGHSREDHRRPVYGPCRICEILVREAKARNQEYDEPPYDICMGYYDNILSAIEDDIRDYREPDEDSE